MRKKVRRLSNHRNDIGRKEEYKKALTDYNKQIRKQKRRSF